MSNKLSYQTELAWKKATGGMDRSPGSWASSMIPLKSLTNSLMVAVVVVDVGVGARDDGPGPEEKLGL